MQRQRESLVQAHETPKKKGGKRKSKGADERRKMMLRKDVRQHSCQSLHWPSSSTSSAMIRCSETWTSWEWSATKTIQLCSTIVSNMTHVNHDLCLLLVVLMIVDCVFQRPSSDQLTKLKSQLDTMAGYLDWFLDILLFVSTLTLASSTYLRLRVRLLSCLRSSFFVLPFLPFFLCADRILMVVTSTC